MPFTNDKWNVSDLTGLDADDYCKVCLVDINPSGERKAKGMCRLPVRATPSGPYNRNAIRNAMGRIFQLKGVPADKKRAAARRLVSLAREADISIGESVLRLAGVRKK
jgi:hypothetical protein